MTCFVTTERPATTAVRPPATLALLLILAVGALAGGCGGVNETNTAAELLINPRLGPEYSQWLIGPVSRLATAAEIDAFMALADDGAAAAWIDRFWAAHNPYPQRPDNVLRETFETRAAEADKRYSEAGYLGRRTARGTLFILYGGPQKIDHQLSPEPRDPPVEVWIYPAEAPPGLDGQRPQHFYRFVKRGDVTELYTPPRPDPRPRRPGESF